jgi:hypothetical protein
MDQEKERRRWLPGYEPGAIRIVRDHLLAIGLHAIGSAAVQLCPDGDSKAIRLLSEGFLAGVKGDRTRSSSQYSRPTADRCAEAGSTN